ncbi:hypothetical protein [Methylobacterium sp. J-026]|nr:hypothetical protein [Methylobacterium sp. J-026]
MRLRLTRTAARQLDHVLADITRHHPAGADAARRLTGVAFGASS